MRTCRNTRRSLGLQNPGRFFTASKTFDFDDGVTEEMSACVLMGLNRHLAVGWGGKEARAGRLQERLAPFSNKVSQQSLDHAHALQQPLSHACCFTSPSQRACRLLLWPGESITCRQGDSRQRYFQFGWHTAQPPQMAPIIMMTTCTKCFLHAKHRSASGQRSS